ncbi:uncharacterized protein [Amphiura filiformis]|uniref:uncharacterized protein isoform X2 n=1 Tax=Amphiura filiformis TaxID=82378 RepID=UPI003B225462
MPTSGEARIHASSSYNLRSRPLPKTKQASVANKENVGKRGVSNSRIPTRKSKLPVNSSSRKPPVSSSGGSSGTKTSNTRVRGVPNFEKLHKNWQKKFQQGKAVTKKPCTRAHEFDLTRPGTHFKGAYYSGDDHTDTEDEFQVDQDALQSILDDRGLSNDAITGRSTVATMGGGRSNNTRAVEHRQTLGALPTHSNAYNKSLSAAKTPRQAMGFSAQRNKSRKKSLVDEQQLDDLEFETDASALATILNNVGLQPARDHNGMTRQTIASMQARTFQRN